MTYSLQLQNDNLRLLVLPSLGGGLAYFDVKTTNGNWSPLFRSAPNIVTDPNEMAFYPLLPWSNRVTPTFSWRGDHYHLERNYGHEPFPIHGDGWISAWEVQAITERSVVLHLLSNRSPPYFYEATLKYEINDDALTISMCVTHRGEKPIPYGIGLHPWIHRTVDTTLTALYKGQWIEDSDSHLPVQRIAVTDYQSQNKRRTNELPSGYINCIFDGWDSKAMVQWVNSGLSMTIRSDPLLNYFVLYSIGDKSNFFCFEPVSHLINAHASKTPLAHGLHEMSNGESLSASTIFQINKINSV